MGPLSLALLVLAASDDGGARPLLPEPWRAEQVCPYDGLHGHYECRTGDLARYQVAGVDVLSVPADAEALVVPLYADGGAGCLLALDVVIRSGVGDLLVDWSGASLVVDGVATQVVPGYARRATSSLSQRPAVAPRGTSLHEQAVAIDRDCMTPPLLQSAEASIALSIPVRVGERDDVLRWSQQRSWVGATEADVFSHLPEPPVSAEPPPPDEPMNLIPWGIVAGVGAGAGAAVVGGVVGGVLGFAAYSKTAPLVALPCALGCGAASGLGVGVVGVAVGGAIDFFRFAGYDDDRRKIQAQEDARDAWRAAKHQHDEWTRKRADLGLAAGTPPSAF